MSTAANPESSPPPSEAELESDGSEDTHEARNHELVRIYLKEHGAQFSKAFVRESFYGHRLRKVEETFFQHSLAGSAYPSLKLGLDTHDTALAKARGVERARIHQNIWALSVKHKPLDLYWRLLLSKGQDTILNRLLGPSFPTLDATIQGYILMGDLVQMSFLEQVARFLRLTVILSDILYYTSAKSELLGFLKDEVFSEWKKTLNVDLQREAGPHVSLSAAHLHRSTSLAEDILLINQYRQTSTNAQEFSSHITPQLIEELRIHASRIASETSAAVGDGFKSKRSLLRSMWRSIVSGPSKKRESITLVHTVQGAPKSPTFPPDKEKGRFLRELFYQALAGWALFYRKHEGQVTALAALAEMEDPFKLIRDVFVMKGLISCTTQQPSLPHKKGSSWMAEMGNFSRGVYRLAERIESEGCDDVAARLFSIWEGHCTYSPGFGSNSGFWKDEEVNYRPDDAGRAGQSSPSDEDALPTRIISMNDARVSLNTSVTGSEAQPAEERTSMPSVQTPEGSPRYNSNPNDQLLQEESQAQAQDQDQDQENQPSPCPPPTAQGKAKAKAKAKASLRKKALAKKSPRTPQKKPTPKPPTATEPRAEPSPQPEYNTPDRQLIAETAAFTQAVLKSKGSAPPLPRGVKASGKRPVAREPSPEVVIHRTPPKGSKTVDLPSVLKKRPADGAVDRGAKRVRWNLVPAEGEASSSRA